jgi:hypothetical protein
MYIFRSVLQVIATSMNIYLVFFDNIGESFEAFSIDGARNTLLGIRTTAIVLESQRFQFQTGNPQRWMGRDGDSHPVLVKVHGQDRVVEGFFPVQDRGDLGRFAQFSHQLGMHIVILCSTAKL